MSERDDEQIEALIDHAEHGYTDVRTLAKQLMQLAEQRALRDAADEAAEHAPAIATSGDDYYDGQLHGARTAAQDIARSLRARADALTLQEQEEHS